MICRSGSGWRKCTGIEPAESSLSRDPIGFEDRARHQPWRHFHGRYCHEKAGLGKSSVLGDSVNQLYTVPTGLEKHHVLVGTSVGELRCEFNLDTRVFLQTFVEGLESFKTTHLKGEMVETDVGLSVESNRGLGLCDPPERNHDVAVREEIRWVAFVFPFDPKPEHIDEKRLTRF